MEREFIITLILAVPVILLPAVLLWYLYTSRISPVTRAAQRRRAVREEGIGAASTEQRFVERPLSEQYHTRTAPEEVHMESENIKSIAVKDSLLTAVMPDVMPELDDDGYMLHPEMWTEETAELLAQGLVPGGLLTEEHWRVIHYLRDYYLKYGTVPPVRKLCRDTHESLQHIYELFPGNYPRCLCAGLTKCACKIAGMPWLSYKQYP
jgi:tRNA 2-thiouridine synthesizing protein E